MAGIGNLMKRGFDFMVAAILLLLLAPVLLILFGLVRWKLGAPALFIQTRPGYRAEPFRLIKFRTMIDAHDSSGALLPDGMRLTPFGRWLRKTSLDELPELVNVVMGDMSLVGPRPLLMDYVPLYSAQQARRHEVRPGITGLAQVCGRNAIGWDEKFALDIEYVERHNLAMDIRILLLTLRQVLKRDGISADGEATMPAFRGNDGGDRGPG